MKKSILLISAVMFMIFLMVNFPVSNSYFLEKIFGEEKIVSAETLKCCPETEDGAICQDVLSQERCTVGLLPTDCTNSADCKIGCCVDGEEGLCSTRSTKFKCESDGGIWKNDESCLIPECQRGCCILENDAQFVTEQNCEKLSLTGGLQKDFRDIRNEVDCLETVGRISEILNQQSKKNTGCVDEDGNKRKNGESWCAYDGFIGEGKDTVGSRHWKQSCVDGEVVNEGCSDYRGQICVQSEIIEGSQKFSTASCIMNMALQCIKYNEDSNMKTKCQEDKSCMIKNVNVDSGFKFDVCVGRYPRGLDLVDTSGVDDALCSLANQKCVVTYQKDSFGGWDCVNNCNCREKIFAEQMNDFCVSLGDCGSYVNYIGKGTDNIKVTNAPSVSGERYADYAEKVPGQFAESPDLSKYLNSVVGNSEEFDVTKTSDFTKIVGYLGHIVGGAGTLVKAAVFLNLGALSGTTVEGTKIAASLTAVTETTAAGVTTTTATTLGAFAGAATGASIGGMAGYYLAKILGLQGSAVGAMALAGAVAGGALGYSYITGASLFSSTGLLGLSALGWTAVAGLVFMAYIAIIGWGKTKQVNVEFTCMPWQAPTGGDDCKKCNEDNSKPCTEYRCSSLGQACKLLNTNEENPICESVKYEPNPPVISLGKVLTQDYNFLNEEVKRVEIRKTDGKCIQEFTPVLFTLKTDEFSQCKYSFGKTNVYEEMGEYPLEQNSFSDNHTFAFSIPSIDSLSVYNVTGNLKEKFANLNMYIRCQDYHGNFNIDEYVVNFCVNSGPDTTAVNHQLTIFNPKNNGFLKYQTTQKEIRMWVNEPAECKYDFVGGKNYDEMANTMSCKTNLEEAEVYGWPCDATLNLSKGVNKFYIKCKDKLWVETAEDIVKYSERNVNAEDFIYTLNVVENPLKINSITPQGNLEAGAEPISVELEVKTSGGVENGKSKCSYEWGGNWVQFLNTFSNSHTQPNLGLMSGDYNFSIKCEDDADNIAKNNSVFKLKVDSSPPIAVRVFYSGSELKLITNEKAECVYDTTSCIYDFANATSMTTVPSKEHSASWTVGKTYYIRCRDIWGNTNPDCIIKVAPTN